MPNLQAADLFGSNVYVAPMARDVGDTLMMFAVIRGFDRRDPFGQARPPTLRRLRSFSGLRVAWLPVAGNPVDREIAAITAEAMRMIEGEGAVGEEVQLDFAALEPHFMVILETLLAGRVGNVVNGDLARIDPTLKVHVENGQKHGALALAAAAAARTHAFSLVQDLLERFDTIASPTLSAPPLPHDQDPHGSIPINGVPSGRVRAVWYPYTIATNLTGHPSISIPCAWNSHRQPVGFHMTAAWYQEDFLLDCAELSETLFGFDLKALSMSVHS